MDFRNTTLTILSGQTDSELLDSKAANMRGPIGVLVISPASLPETVNVVVSRTLTGQFGVLQSGGADIVLAAGKAVQLSFVTPRAIKLRATSTVAGDRVFDLIGNRFTMSA